VFNNSKSTSKQSGETIIEVMMSVVILGFTITTVFAITQRALQTGLAASERTRVQMLVESQLERLKYIASQPGANGADSIFNNQDVIDGDPFCVAVNDAGDMSILVNDTSNVDCLRNSGLPPEAGFSVGIIYDQDGANDADNDFDNNTFTVTADWDRVGGNSGDLTEKLVKVYRLHESALGSPTATPPPPPPPGGPGSPTALCNSQDISVANLVAAEFPGVPGWQQQPGDSGAGWQNWRDARNRLRSSDVKYPSSTEEYRYGTSSAVFERSQPNMDLTRLYNVANGNNLVLDTVNCQYEIQYTAFCHFVDPLPEPIAHGNPTILNDDCSPTFDLPGHDQINERMYIEFFTGFNRGLPIRDEDLSCTGARVAWAITNDLSLVPQYQSRWTETVPLQTIDSSAVRDIRCVQYVHACVYEDCGDSNNDGQEDGGSNFVPEFRWISRERPD